MRKLLFFSFLLVIASQVVAQKDFKAPEYETVSSKVKQLPSHPRILFQKQQESTLKTLLKQDPLRNNLHQAILTECERIISLPPVERIQIGKRLLDKSRECLRRVFQLSYAYRMTGDKRFLERAEKELLAVSAFSDWNPSHFLDVAEMTMAVAIGYDWLQESLPESSKEQIRNAIIQKGINPSFDNKYNWFLTSEHNWNQVCNAGMTFGALAIADHEPDLASRTIHRALETTPKSMLPYAPDGAYPEGYGYWEYGTSFNVLLISAMDVAFGTDFGLSAIEGFLKTGGFLQNMIGPTGLVHNWGDSGLQARLSPATFWFADKTGDPSLLWNQVGFLSGSQSANVRNRLLPATLIWGLNSNLNQLNKPEELLWYGQGPNPVALMRTSWDDPNAIFVGFKAGSATVNHAHMDAGSFVLDAQGERWAMDFGMQEYHSLESRGIRLWGREQDAQRWQIFRYNNFVHNTITVDSSLQRVNGYAGIDIANSASDHLFAISDLSDIYKGQVAGARRGIAIRDKKVVVVRDEIEAPERDVKIRWTLLTPAAVRIVDKKTVELTQKGKKLYLSFDIDSDFTIKTWSTTPPNDYDAPNPGTRMVGFETRIPAGKKQAFNAYFSETANIRHNSTPLSGWKANKTK